MKPSHLLLSVNLATCMLFFRQEASAQYDDFMRSNSKLIQDNAVLRNKLATKELDVDKLNLEIKNETQKRAMYETQVKEEQRKSEVLQAELNRVRQQMAGVKSERDKLREDVKTMQETNSRVNRQYEDAMIEIDELNTEYRDLKKEYEELETQFDERQIVVDILKRQIRDIESELKDMVSLSTQRVFFNDNIYDFDAEILFVPFAADSMKTSMTEDQQYLLTRFANLVKKYDYKLQVRLIGESEDDSKEAGELSQQKADFLRNILIKEYGVPEESIASTKVRKDKGRNGVSVRAEK